jgi:hypothetical protein
LDELFLATLFVNDICLLNALVSPHGFQIVSDKEFELSQIGVLAAQLAKGLTDLSLKDNDHD